MCSSCWYNFGCSCGRFCDWIIIAGLWTGVTLSTFYLTPHEQCIAVENASHPNPCSYDITGRNPEINYPLHHETVPFNMLVGFSPLPWIIVVVLSIIVSVKCMLSSNVNKNKNGLIFSIRNDWFIIFMKISGITRNILASLGLTQFIGSIVKNLIGRPRPNYWNYKDRNYDASITSFPSGHASFSFGMFTLLTLYLLHSVKTVQKLKYINTKNRNSSNNGENMYSKRQLENNKENKENTKAKKTGKKSLKNLQNSTIGKGKAKAKAKGKGKGKGKVNSAKTALMNTSRRSFVRNNNNNNGNNSYYLSIKEKIDYYLSKNDLIEYFRIWDDRIENNFLELEYDSERYSFVGYGNIIKSSSSIYNDDDNDTESISLIKCQMISNSMFNNGDIYFGFYLWYLLQDCKLLSIVIASLPVLFSIFVACSRIIDYFHHYEDVLAGGLIGFTCSYITFNIFSNEYYSCQYIPDLNVEDGDSNNDNDINDDSGGRNNGYGGFINDDMNNMNNIDNFSKSPVSRSMKQGANTASVEPSQTVVDEYVERV